MTDAEYESICDLIWALYKETQTLAVRGSAKRNILFPPPRRSRPVDLLVVGISPNQAAPVNYTHTFDGLKDFARTFRYVSGGAGGNGQHYDAYYYDLLRFLRRADERFGVWWEVEAGTRQLLVEFTDALHVATEPGNDDLSQFVDPRTKEGKRRRQLCRKILQLELEYYQPKMAIGNGRLPSDMLWEICTGNPVQSSPSDCMTQYVSCDCTIHLSGYLTAKSMDAYSKVRLLKELKEHVPLVSGD